MRLRKGAKIFWITVGGFALLMLLVFGSGMVSTISNHDTFTTVPQDRVTVLSESSNPVFVPKGMKIDGKVKILFDADDKGIKEIGTMENKVTSEEVLVLPAEQTVIISPCSQ